MKNRFFFFFQAEDGIRDATVTGVQTCALPISDNPVQLPVTGDVVAGTKSRSGMGPGLTVRIMTGAPIPAGADAVIPLERTDRGVAKVTSSEPVLSGECIRRAGEDLAAGAPALSAGAAIGPQQIALLAA